MFRGFNSLNIDEKGRLAIPRQYHEGLSHGKNSCLILTLSPMDRAIFLYSLAEWEKVEAKLSALSDFDKQSRRAKQMMRGYASDCSMDAQGRILIPQALRDYAVLTKKIGMSGQGNKFEIWDADAWVEQREQWLLELGDETDKELSARLKSLSL